jgi:hypothetical protein
MKRFLLPLLLFCSALPLAAQVNDTYVIPAVGNTPGAFGTRWMTQLSIFNPQLDYALKVAVVYIPSGGGRGLEALLTVPPNGGWFSDNALEDIFGVSGTGALVAATFPEDNPGVPNATLDRSFLVTSNTFNNSRSGTFGQTIPGIWTGLQDFATDHISAVAHGVRNLSAQGWRTNVGAVNLGRESVKLRVTVYDYDGRTLQSDIPFTVPPLGHLQDTLPVQVDRGSIEFFLDDPSQDAVVFPYISVIDQFSGDPSYQTPVLLAGAKSLFAKGVLKPTEIGKKIGLETARKARANADSIGEVKMKTAHGRVYNAPS